MEGQHLPAGAVSQLPAGPSRSEWGSATLSAVGLRSQMIKQLETELGTELLCSTAPLITWG